VISALCTVLAAMQRGGIEWVDPLLGAHIMNQISTTVAKEIPEHAMEIVKPGEETEAEHETRREWDLYVLFFIKRRGANPMEMRRHTEWLWGQFGTVARWLAAKEWHRHVEGEPLPRGFKAEWKSFVTEHAGRSADNIEEELNKIEDATPMW
jgi:hypothetical protein